MVRASLFALVPFSIIACTAEPPLATDEAAQQVINTPLPGDLSPALNAKTTLTLGPGTRIEGDVVSSGPKGSVLFDVNASQFAGNTLANTVVVRTDAFAGHVFGNDLTIDGAAAQRSLGLDPGALPQVPAGTAPAPGTTNISIATNQAKQLCPGRYGTISLAGNATLNLNGGVYELTKLSLADGARLVPSEPVVILVSGTVTTGVGARIEPFSDVVTPMTAADIRIEAGGTITLGNNTTIRAHLLTTTGKLTTGTGVSLTGAAWAKSIAIGASGFITGEGLFTAQAANVPPPCNDGNACTTDTCVGGGTASGICRNTPVAAGTSCEDGNACNGGERCNATGSCQPGTPLVAGTSCADGNACNGDETCDGLGECAAGTPPVVNDGNSCTVDRCDPATGVSNTPLPDGTRCSGTGMCGAGTCSVQGTVFSEGFLQFQDSPAQCTSWNNFRGELTESSYLSVTMSGTFDPLGTTCSDPASANQICQALHTGNFASVFCNGHVWNVGTCGGTVLNLDSGVCSCDFFSPGHTVRPCFNFDNWGGVNTQTCEAPSQTMTVVCQ